MISETSVCTYKSTRRHNAKSNKAGLCSCCLTSLVCAGMLAIISSHRSVLVIARERKQVTKPLKFIAILSPFISTRVPIQTEQILSFACHSSYLTKSELLYCCPAFPYRHRNKIERATDLISFRWLQTATGMKRLGYPPKSIFIYTANLIR